MNPDTTVSLLLVDDEDEFRASARRTLERRGFRVTEASSGQTALTELRQGQFDLVVLDLKMPVMDGIETLRRLRESHRELPVIILTGHGSFHDAFAGIKLDIVDFLQKPVDMDRLADTIRQLLWRGTETEPLRERSIAELMVSPRLYPHLYVDQSAEEAFQIMTDLFFRPQPASVDAHGIRSALVFDRTDHFLGMLRFNDLLKLVLPRFLADSPYTTFFTGMFLAQCKVIGQRSFVDMVSKRITIDLHAPLMQAVNLMVKSKLISLPVMDGEALAGVLRDRAIILEMAKNTSSPR